ncbi:hypothetical protein WG70_25700 [Burkholderia oklahomensis EO147]|nr:hypothetical protein WG70_25700 [Burkholderia oklahomensis EO147]
MNRLRRRTSRAAPCLPVRPAPLRAGLSSTIGPGRAPSGRTGGHRAQTGRLAAEDAALSARRSSGP